jgi:RNA polymerase-binding transcription factor DksA
MPCSTPFEEGSMADDPLARKAEDVERSREFIQETSFSGSEQDVSGELSSYDQHPADSSDVVEQRARDFAIDQILEAEAEQIRHAQERKAAGTYGVCEECGRPISQDRLAARPEATLCIECAKAREAARP